MAGKSQHHVWQALQRGFGLFEFNEHHVWVYRRVGPPERTTTRLIGCENFFYGERNSPADSSVTRFENLLQSSVQDWRKMPNGSSVDSYKAAALVAHLEMRSQFIRDEATMKIGATVDFVKDSMSSADILKILLRAYLNNDEEMRKHGVTSDTQKLAIDAIESKVLDLSIQNQVKDFNFLRFIPSGHSEELLEAIRKSHNSVLSTDFFTAKRTESHRQLQYSVFRPTDGFLILPDTCLTFFLKDRCSPISQKNDHVESVIVPIAIDCAIVGSKGLAATKSITTLNRSLASCALEWFISPEESAVLERLALRIGRNAQLIAKSKMGEVLKVEALAKALRGS